MSRVGDHQWSWIHVNGFPIQFLEELRSERWMFHFVLGIDLTNGIEGLYHHIPSENTSYIKACYVGLQEINVRKTPREQRS